MSLSLYPLSAYPISALPAEYSQATENPLANLLRGADIELNYLIELDPFDETVTQEVKGAPLSTIPLGSLPVFTRRGGTRTIYLSDKGFYTGGGDTPAHTSYLPLVNNPFQFDVSILNGREFRGGLPSFGAVRIKAGNGDMDALGSYFWSGRDATVYAGGKDFARADYEAIFRGKVRDIEYDEGEIIINISDKSGVLETAFDQKLYTGTGGTEGGDDIKGDVKPLCYGQVKNVPLKLVNAGLNIYQVHDGEIEEVTAVYDRGVSLSSEGDVADITATSVTGGSFKTQLTGGYIRLGGNPDGAVTADVKGDSTGSYIDKTGAIISRLVSTKMAENNFGSNDIDQGALNALDLALPNVVGIFINERTQLTQVLNELTIPLNLFWYFTREGALSAGIVQSPSAPVLSIEENTIIDDSFSCLRVIPPAWRISVGYQKNWSVQSLDTIAPAATDAQKSFALEPYRTTTVEDRGVRGKTKSEFEVQFDTALAFEADAEAYRDRLASIYQVQRSSYRFKAKDLIFKVFIGDVIRVSYPRYGLESGKNFLITAVSEDAEDNATELEVWG